MTMAETCKPIPSMPRETARAAQAVFGRSNVHMLIGEHLETILGDLHLEMPTQEGSSSMLEAALLALITFFQFVEGLTDVQAADAIRTRTDWKFALHLSLIPVPFQEDALCEFRQRLLFDFASQLEFQRLLERLTRLIPSLRHHAQEVNSLSVLAFVCSVNRLNRAQQAMQQALEVLAVQFPEWLRKVALPHWYGRYNRATPRLEVALLLGQQRFLIAEIGADIHHLLQEVHLSGSHELGELPEINVLDQLWTRQFQTRDLDHWPEPLTLDHCQVCPYKSVGRRK